VGRFAERAGGRAIDLRLHSAHLFDICRGVRIRIVALDAPGATDLPRAGGVEPVSMGRVFEAHRLDFMVAQFRRLIETLERITGTQFEEASCAD